MEDGPLMMADEWLSAEDDATRSSRAVRLAFVLQAGGPLGNMLIPGGFVPARALDEARWCYVNGQFLASVLLCQAMLEHVLAGQYALMGKDSLIKKGFERLCDEALADHLISPSEHCAFASLRLLRNPYVHPKRMNDPKRMERRMMTENLSQEDIVEGDARQALLTVLRLMERYPFSFASDTEPSG